MRPVLTVSAMAVVVAMTGARPCRTGSKQQHRGGSNDDRSEPFRPRLGVSGHCNSSSCWCCPVGRRDSGNIQGLGNRQVIEPDRILSEDAPSVGAE
jgi:hypothetical protein